MVAQNTLEGVTEMTKNPKPHKLLSNAKNWGREALLLREILLECNLNEEITWRSPCYTHSGKHLYRPENGRLPLIPVL